MSLPRRNFQRRFIIAATASSCSPAKRRGNGGSCFGRECCESPRTQATHCGRSNEGLGLWVPRRASFARDDSVCWHELPPGLLPPRCKILQRLLIRCRIEPDNAPALADLFRHKILKCRRLESLVCDFVGE